MFAMCITVYIAIFNIFLANHLPFVQGVILILHFAGWIAIVVPLRFSAQDAT